MLYSLRRCIHSLLRASRSCGFGVQSPFAYKFVTRVVRDGKYYSEYADLENQYAYSKYALRLHKFYFRLSKYLEDNGDVDSLFIIEGIHNNRKAYKTWLEIINDSSCHVSFDLFDCGVLFTDEKMHKHNYKVMLK